ncbi:hypothetical protein I0C86_41415 [Plantactinospora sp. S1510]|uniref:Holin n=1 Tax=Plantactinospora alkalitolerans TaxID=2789879 RepID=A0ABS0HB24_9ACTN|nr:hypothetical protein [Plantactinospora alkalitolerans]MBF9135312.1 hypothetical protein [Plantactinospora alkalitolerans]
MGPRRWWRRADTRLRLSAALLGFVVAGWPASAAWVWIAKGFDPFEQLMLFLSWGALGYTSGDMIFTNKAAEGGRDSSLGRPGE